MIGLKRLDDLHSCIQQVLRDDVPGDFIETGVWRGGACIFMRATLKAYGVSARRVWVADSFVGGYAIIDDYGEIEACRKAVNDFRASNKIAASLSPIDLSGVCWKKQV